MTSLDLVVRNARTVDREGLHDYAFAAGRYVDIAYGMGNGQTLVIEANGKLAIPGFIEPHIHLDKALINEDLPVNRTGTLAEAIEISRARKRRYTVDDVVDRAGRMIRSAVQNGVTRMRTHVDVDMIGGLRPLAGVLESRRRHDELIDLEIVAFPQEGILRQAGVEDLLRQAMDMGADLIGGMPFTEESPEQSRQHIRIVFDIAQAHDCDVDMHIDESDDPSARTLEMLAEETIARGWCGRVTAGHACALAAYSDAHADYVIGLIKEAGIHVVMNPATNLMLQGRSDRHPKRRGITRVKELIAAGVNVSLGQDNVNDTFYPFGRADSLEVALIAAHAAHMSQPREIGEIFAMSTRNAASLLRLSDYGMTPGCQGDLVLLDAESPTEAIARQADRLCVIKRGRIVAETVTHQRLYWSG